MSHHFESKLATYLKNDITAATVLEILRNWIAYNRRHNRNYREGRFWTYNTLKQWEEQVSFCTRKQLYNRICKLKDKGLIYTKKFNQGNGDQTLWYTVNEEKYQQIMDGTYINDDTDIDKPRKPKIKKLKVEDILDEKGKMADQFPNTGNSINNTINNKKKKKEIKRRGWYLPPDYEDYNTWAPSDHIKGKIKNEFQLTDEQIDDAYKEFVLYNNAMGIKIRSLVAMFTLWCKRFAKKVKRYVKKTYKRANKVIAAKVTDCKAAIVKLISINKDKKVSNLNTALLEYFGAQRYRDIGLMELKPIYDVCTSTLDFVSIGLYLPDGIYRLRTLKADLLSVVRTIYHDVVAVKVCGT